MSYIGAMQIPHVVALGVFTSYFLAILALLFLITNDLRKLGQHSDASALMMTIFIALVLASFAHTWFYMFKYMAWSFSDYGRALPADSQDLLTQVASWLHDTSLFEQAWALVCFNPLNWWLSEQLCLFTVGAWTIFLSVEGRRHQIKHLWAYMLLGQIVAISVATNLFYLAVLLSLSATARDKPPTKFVSPRLWLSVMLSLVTVAASPFTSRQTFLPNLLIMHAVIFLPLLPFGSVYDQKEPSYSSNTRVLYNLVCVASAAIHIRTTLVAYQSLSTADSSTPLHAATAAWRVLHSHPAQSSIGWDVIWTSISFIVWIFAKPGRQSEPSKYLSVPYLLLATPFASVGVTAPYILQPRGRDPEATMVDKRD